MGNQTRQLFVPGPPKFAKRVSFPSAFRVSRFRLLVSGPLTNIALPPSPDAGTILGSSSGPTMVGTARSGDRVFLETWPFYHPFISLSFQHFNVTLRVLTCKFQDAHNLPES